MSVDREHAFGPTVVPGSTVVGAAALHHLALGLVRNAAGVPLRDVTVRLEDRRGALHLGVTVPGELDDPRVLGEQAQDLREALVRGMRVRAGRVLGGVDVRYTGVVRTTRRRVA